MHPIVFQMKRGHLASMKACRFLIRVVKDMTPARFDILLLLRRAGFGERRTKRARRMGLLDINACFMSQEGLVNALGLHKTTVSEMLTRLEELGWVERTRDRDPRRWRCNVVALTALGYRRTWQACKILFRARVLKTAVSQMVRGLQSAGFVEEGAFGQAFEKVWETINQIARWFGDTSQSTVYDGQIGYAIPGLTPLEMHLGRYFGTAAGPRVPDFVLHFVATREEIERRRRERGSERASAQAEAEDGFDSD